MTVPKRHIRMTLGAPGSLGRVWTELDMDFRVVKDGGEEPNSADVTLYNLNRESREFAGVDNQTLIVEAGYDVLRTLFVGDVIWGESTHIGTDSITKIEAADGGRSYRDGVATVVAPPGANRLSVLSEAASQAGLLVSMLTDEELVARMLRPYPYGFSYSGAVRNLIRDLAESAGADWSIQDGVITLMAPNGRAGALTAVMSPDTGLIGSPKSIKADLSERRRRARGSSSDVREGYEVTHLLNMTLEIGQAVVLSAASVTGVYIAQKVRYEGSYHQREFYLNAELMAP